jgi:hypothetical protein
MLTKLAMSLRFIVLAIAVAVPATTWARVPGDWTDDDLITSGASPSMVDYFDLMIWNNFKFSANPNGHLVGDENGDGLVDGGDLFDWNSNKFTDDGGGTAGCNAATTVCVTDAAYLTALTSAPRNIPDASNSAFAPIFTATNSFSDLNVAIQPDTLLQSFTVVTPNAATSFDSDFAGSAYYHGRQQWFNNSPGFDPSSNGFVASFPTGSLAGSTVFWEIETVSAAGPAGIFVGMTIPEPSSPLILLMALGMASLPGVRRR